MLSCKLRTKWQVENKIMKKMENEIGCRSSPNYIGMWTTYFVSKKSSPKKSDMGNL